MKALFESLMKYFGYVREELLKAAEENLAATKNMLSKERAAAAAYKRSAEAQLAARDKEILSLKGKLDGAAKEKKALLRNVAALEAKVERTTGKAKMAVATERERSAKARRELLAKAAKTQRALARELRKSQAKEKALLKKLAAAKAAMKVARKTAKKAARKGGRKKR